MAQLLGVSADTWLAWESGGLKLSAAACRLMEVLLWLYKDDFQLIGGIVQSRKFCKIMTMKMIYLIHSEGMTS